MITQVRAALADALATEACFLYHHASGLQAWCPNGLGGGICSIYEDDLLPLPETAPSDAPLEEYAEHWG